MVRISSKPGVIAFLSSAAICWIGYVGVDELARHWFKSPELVTVGFCWGALFLLVVCAMALAKIAKLTTFLAITTGFSLAGTLLLVWSLREFPVPIEIYIRTVIGLIIQSTTAVAVGLLIGSIFRRRLQESR